MADINASSNARLSREMYTALFKDSQAKFLVDSILADGQVNASTDTSVGPSDAAALGKLRAHLAKAAGSSPEASALLNALDASSQDGASADVVLQNLRKIQNLQKQVSETGLDPTQVSFELSTQTNEEKFEGVSHTLSVSLDSSASPTETSAPAPGSDIPFSADSQNHLHEESARQNLIGPFRSAQGEAVNNLKYSAETLRDQLSNPAQTPDSKLRQDLTRLAGCMPQERGYVKQVLDSIGLKESALTKQGILKQPDDGQNDQRLKDFLASPAFEKNLTPTALKGYRNLLTTTLGNYAKDPGKSNFDQLREIIYDHSYVFENAEGVSAEAVDQYKQMKQNILAVSQQSNLLEKVSDPANLPKSMDALRSDLQASNNSANADTLRLAGQVSKMLDQLEGHPELYPGVDCKDLRSQLESMVTRDAEGKLSGLKNPPPGQAHLNTLNQIWAEVESVGLKAGLGDEFSSGGALTQALDRAVAQDPARAEDPMVKLLKAAPELGEYTDLLSQLSQPENKPMLDALLNNQGQDVSKFFSEYNSRFFDFSSILGNFGTGFALGTAAGGLTGGLLGGALNLGFNYGKSLFPGTTPAKPAGGLDLTANPDPFKLNIGQPNNLSFGGLNLGLPALNPATPGQSPTPSGKNMKLFGLSQTDAEAVMKLLAAKPEARALLQQNGSNLNQLLQASPANAEIRSALDAKKAFNDAFWSNSSSLEDTQASIQGAITARSNAQISLTQASIAVQNALEAPDLRPDVRQLLESQKGQIAASLSALESGGEVPAGSADLDKTIEAVRDANLQTGVTSSEEVINHARQFLDSKSIEPLLTELSTAIDNGQMQQLLDKLPQAQRDQLRPLITDKEGKLSSASLSKRMHMALDSQTGSSADMANQITANLKALTGLVQKANEPGATPESLEAYGKQVLPSNAPLQGSPFDVISDMHFMQDAMRELRSTVGKEAMQESARRFVTESNAAMQELQQQHPDQPVTREELHAKMRERLTDIKNLTLNQSLLDGLSAGATASQAEEATEVEAPQTQASVAESITSSPLAQAALQNVFGRVSEKMQANPEIKPILDRLSSGNTAVMGELQTLMSKAGSNPASLGQDIQALLSKHMNPQDAQKLQSALVGEINNQLGQYIGQAEKALGNYSRTDTRKAQSDLIDILKAYQGMVQTTQGLDQSEQRVKASASEAIFNISADAGRLLNSPGMLPEGVKPKDFLGKIFPSLFEGNPREDKLVKDLSSFLALDQSQLEEKLGAKLTPEQFMGIQLAASSLATSRFIQDPNRGPAAKALSELVKNAIAHPEALNDASLKAVLAEAAGIKDPQSLGSFLSHLESIDPAAATAGKELASQLKTAADQVRQRLQLSQPPQQSGSPIAPPGPAPKPGQVQPTPSTKATPEQNPVVAQTALPPVVPSPGGVDLVQPGNSMESTVNGLVSGLNIKATDLPPAVAAQTTTDATGKPTFTVQAAEVSPELNDQLWTSSLRAIDRTIETYKRQPPDIQMSIRQHSPISRYMDQINEDMNRFVQVQRTENSYCDRMLRECKERWQVYQAVQQQMLAFLKQNPNIVSEVMDKAFERLKPKVDPDQEAESLEAKADALAQKMLAPAPGNDDNSKLGDAVMDYLNSIRNHPPQAQKLALADLAQKMITSAIHSFYDKKAQESNKRHFQMLAELAENLHKQIDAELRQSLAGPKADAARDGTASLNQGLRRQIETMLSAAQQMHPPMLTDFKRNQILQALFDQDPGNDLQGLLMLTSAEPQHQN